jgi:2-polyprenyl-6-methoxyphenol hydroxylase-like FAD-dependent oxidoreductase
MANDCDVLIAGTGVAGPLLACALSGSGLRIALCGARPPAAKDDSYDLRVSALTPATVAVLSRLGAWRAIEPRAGRIETMRVRDEDRKSVV